jgi:hypothetical protein
MTFIYACILAWFSGASPAPWGEAYALEFKVADGGYRTLGWCSGETCVRAGEVIINDSIVPKGTLLCWRIIPRVSM